MLGNVHQPRSDYSVHSSEHMRSKPRREVFPIPLVDEAYYLLVLVEVDYDDRVNYLLVGHDVSLAFERYDNRCLPFYAQTDGRYRLAFANTLVGWGNASRTLHGKTKSRIWRIILAAERSVSTNFGATE